MRRITIVPHAVGKTVERVTEEDYLISFYFTDGEVLRIELPEGEPGVQPVVAFDDFAPRKLID